MTLPEPPFYFPLQHGRYDVAPGLNRFGKDLGGASADQRVFQIDRTFERFRAEKLASRAEQLDKYFCTCDLAPDVVAQVIQFMTQRLLAEHPPLFHFEGDARFHGALTNETLSLSEDEETLDALACQVQEDLAVVSTAPGRGHWLSAIHVCLPNGWAPEEKVGKSFAAIHEPVAGMEAMNRRGDEFVDIMINAADGLVRFAWGVTFDDRLNHHPDKPRRGFDPTNPRAFLRVERQTIWGFPNVSASLFTIRTYLYDCATLRRDPATRDPLVSALRSMPHESLVYKGIAPHALELIDWLSAG